MEERSDGLVIEKWSGNERTMFKTGRSVKNKYQPDFPERFIKLCHEGGSVPEFCEEVEIAKDTFYEYCKQYPAMAEARKIGKSIAEGWWMRQGRKNLVTFSGKDEGTTRFSQRLYEWTMGGRFGQSADRHERMMLEELMRRTAHLAQQTDNVIASEPEYEPSEIDKNEDEHTERAT